MSLRTSCSRDTAHPAREAQRATAVPASLPVRGDHFPARPAQGIWRRPARPKSQAPPNRFGRPMMPRTGKPGRSCHEWPMAGDPLPFGRTLPRYECWIDDRSDR